MEINALLMGLTDNVATCITDIVKGDTVTYRKGNECISLTAEEDIPYWPQDCSCGRSGRRRDYQI